MKDLMLFTVGLPVMLIGFVWEFVVEAFAVGRLLAKYILSL